MRNAKYAISTDKFPAKLRREIWTEEFAKKLFKVEWEVKNDGDFFVGINPVLSDKSLSIVDIAGGSTRIINTPQFAASKQDMLSFYLIKGENSVILDRFGKAEEATPTTGVFIDEGQCYQFYQNCSEFSLASGFIMGLPKTRLLASIPNLHDLLDKPFDSSSEPYRLLQSLISEIAAAPLNDQDLIDSTVDYMHDLLALMLNARGETAYMAKARGLRAGRLKEIINYISHNFSTSELNGKMVAAHFGFSERYLQDLMEEHGRTFTDYLLGVRLKKSAAMLQDPTLRHMLISDIAYSCGFNDLSTFNRAFRRHFGETPRAHRG